MIQAMLVFQVKGSLILKFLKGWKPLFPTFTAGLRYHKWKPLFSAFTAGLWYPKSVPLDMVKKQTTLHSITHCLSNFSSLDFWFNYGLVLRQLFFISVGWSSLACVFLKLRSYIQWECTVFSHTSLMTFKYFFPSIWVFFHEHSQFKGQ